MRFIIITKNDTSIEIEVDLETCKVTKVYNEEFVKYEGKGFYKLLFDCGVKGITVKNDSNQDD